MFTANGVKLTESPTGDAPKGNGDSNICLNDIFIGRSPTGDAPKGNGDSTSSIEYS